MFFIFSCSSEKPTDITKQSIPESSQKSVSETKQALPPSIDVSYSIELKPAEATRNSTLNLILKGFNFQDAKIEWVVNGNPVASQAIPNQFRTAETKRGDTVQAKAIIGGVEILSNTVVIKNTPPELSKVKIMPEIFKPGDKLYVEVSGSDIDEDEVSILYEWTKNSEPAGNTKEIGAYIKRGDRISVKITPFDGEAYGKPITLLREIGNMPPMIAEDKKHIFDGKVWAYQIKATDPDGDDLAYALKTAPAGMTIDQNGLIKWNVPPDFKGRSPVTVSVTDGHGGEATASFNVEINASR